MDRRELGRLSRRVILGVLLPSLFLPSPLLAGTAGKLSGRIVDKHHAPLPGVTVTLPRVRLGGMTDTDGRYNIINVPAGTYEVKVNLLGYRAISVTDVTVSSDQTRKLDLAMEEAPLAMAEVVVSGRSPVVDVHQTGSVSTVSREIIAALPVQELQDVVNLQAGVVGGHFRGGREDEVQYQVDGVSVNDSYSNKSSLRIDRSLLEEVQVISGTFDAEYGQAMSGVVNAVLKRGSSKFEWNAEAFTGGFVFPGDPRRVIDYTLRPAGIQNYQASLTGPTGLPQTFFLVSGRRYVFNDWTYATRRFRPTDRFAIVDGVKQYGASGDGATVPLGYNKEWSGVLKLTNRSLSNIEIGYQAIANLVDARRSDQAAWAFHLDPDGLSKQHTYSIVHGLDWTHTLSKKTFYNVSVRQNYFDYRDNVFGDSYVDSATYAEYRAAGPSVNADLNYADGAVTQGVELTNFKQTTNALMFKSSFVTQVSNAHQVKLGAEIQWPRLEFGTPVRLAQRQVNGVDSLLRLTSDPPDYQGVDVYTPVQGAAYAQEQVEWNDLTFRAGLRLDYFDANSRVAGDPRAPAGYYEGSNRDTIYVPPRPTSAKATISPRLGVSYPISPRASIYFAYGHFYQMPALGVMFDNAHYPDLTVLQSSLNYTARGNPDLRPERTVQYQGGYKNALSDDVGVSLDLFYKDIRDLLGVEFIDTYNDAEYPRFTNVDFGSVLGFTVTLDLRPRRLLSGSVDYTWQRAQGNSSDPRETATRAQAGKDRRPRVIPFNWDQRHTLNLTATLSRPANFSASAVLRVASGQPYTPDVVTGFASGPEDNSGRKPMCALLDLRGEKFIRTAGTNLSVFARVFNALDTKFFNGFVFPDTGSPFYSRSPQVRQDTLNDPARLQAPRRIEVGVSLGGSR
jgi:outer membrane receptor protein involved in Fe transport